MHFSKKTTLLSLVLSLLLFLPVNVRAAQESTDELIRSIINYFQYYQWDAGTDYERLLSQMEQQDPALAQTWSSILDFWIRLNRDMEVHNEVLPDGLPEDDSLCIAVMGYYLKSDGGMRDELYERLRVTLASAEKYPNAYILCTGGGTASENKKVTEASQMAKWLIRQGISEDRIIVEKQARSTIDNAQYGCELLYRDYPQVKSLAVITSDYHIFRSCLYFNTQAALDAYDLNTEPMNVLASATCRIKPNAPSDIETQVEGMSILTNLDVEELDKPSLSRLERIDVGGTTIYNPGEELDLIVSAVYSSGYSREVTGDITYSGFDFEKAGTQTVTVTYQEGDIRKTAAIDVEILPPPTEAPTNPLPAEAAPAETAPLSEAPEKSPAGMALPLLIAGICAVLLMVLLFLKSRQAKKRRRRPKPTIDLN